jgi:hypothetical protein
MRGNRRPERGKILAFALAAENQDRFLAKAAQRGDGRADVGAFGVVIPLDAAAGGDQLQPVRQSLEGFQSADQRCRVYPQR